MPRKLPQNIEAEQALLGTLIVYPDTIIVTIENGLNETDFFVDRNRLIYKTLESLYKEGKPRDFTSLLSRLNDLQLTETVGGIDYLSSLSDAVVSGYSAQHYIDLIMEKSTLRQMIETSEAIINMAFDSSSEVASVVDSAERNFMDIAQKRSTGELRYIDDVLNEVMDDIKEYRKSGGRPTGVKTGYNILDYVTHGLQGSELILLAARPGVGKTALALNFAYNAASFNKDIKPIVVFSLEMAAKSLLERLLSTAAEVNSSIIRKGNPNDEEYKNLNEGSSRLRNLPIYLDESAGITMAQVRSKCRKLKYDKGLSLVIVDYLQLVTVQNKRDNRYLEVSDISHELKALARELDVPVIALSQLSRESEGKTPNLSDLRESGDLEQDADMVIFLYRDKENKLLPEMQSEDSKEEINVNIAKNRNGETRAFRLLFDKSYGKFMDMFDRPQMVEEPGDLEVLE